MKPTLRLLMPTLCLAFSANADWLLSEYATEAADSSQTNALYGIQTFQNVSSSVTTSVPGGYVQLNASTIASDGTEGYSVNIGLLHSLTPDGSAYDLTGLQAITFEYQNSSKITDVLSVRFGSDAYSDALVKAGTIYANDIAGTAALAAGSTWKTATLYVEDFATPSWWADIPDDFPTIDEVLTRVKNIQFNPKTTYTSSGTVDGTACTRCVGPTMTSQTLKIRNVRLVGISSVPSVPVVPAPVAFGQTKVFADRTVSVGASRIGFRFADYFKGATGYAVRNLGAVHHVAATTTTDSLYLGFAELVGGLDDVIEVRADSGARSILDTFVVLCNTPASDLGWLLSEYSTEAADSSQTNALYGIQTFQNTSSSVTTSVPGGYVQLNASTIASDGTEGYSVNLGLLHPITPDWAAYDLTGLRSITFEYQNATKITDVLSVAFGSEIYSDSLVDAGTIYANDIAGSVALAAGSTWKAATIYVDDFVTPAWWTDIPADYPTLDEVLKRVKNIQFNPKTSYTSSGTVDGSACTRCVGPTMTSQTLKIRDVRLVGIDSLQPASGSQHHIDNAPMAIENVVAQRTWRRSGDRLTVLVPDGVQRATLEVRNLEGRILHSASATPAGGEVSWNLGNLHGTFLAQVRSEKGMLESHLLVAP